MTPNSIGRHSLQRYVPEISSGYVITVDNLLKMLSIQLRMLNQVPVVIMGETGCGKSSLIKQLCAVTKTPLMTLNIHGIRMFLLHTAYYHRSFDHQYHPKNSLYS
jgi:ABC-type lipoprotein export system ATPase subunit